MGKIKELNVTRAVGLHRIIGGISKDLEEEFRSEYGIENSTYRNMKNKAIPRANIESKIRQRPY